MADWQALKKRAADLLAAWSALGVTTRYLAIGLAALVVFAVVSGLWISKQIERSIAQSHAPSAMALVQDVVQPLVQGLQARKPLPPDAATAFDNLLSASDIAAQVAVMRLWRPDGTLIYRSDRTAQGAPASLADGSGSAIDQAALEQRLGATLVEIKTPVYRTGTHKIIAVAQLFGRADTLSASLRSIVMQTVLVLALLAAGMLAILFRIVQRASGQIDQQQSVATAQRAEIIHLTSQNEALRKLVDVVHRRGAEHAEKSLRRIGSDLHDGPAQHLALVLLRLDELAPVLDKPAQSGASTPANTLETIRQATSDALKEIRHISSGLALPELQKISLKDALLIAVRAHQRATGTIVAATFDNMPPRLPLPMTICLYRFAQESLNNAFRHAGGVRQSLCASYDGRTISVEVADGGPGFVVDPMAASRDRLGLSGLRYRVESLGGSLQINSQVGQGAKLTVQFRNPLA
jgi:signal transduction histidine kinase